jgi:hypothetical protein
VRLLRACRRSRNAPFYTHVRRARAHARTHGTGKTCIPTAPRGRGRFSESLSPARCFAFQIHDYRGIRIIYCFSIARTCVSCLLIWLAWWREELNGSPLMIPAALCQTITDLFIRAKLLACLLMMSAMRAIIFSMIWCHMTSKQLDCYM